MTRILCVVKCNDLQQNKIRSSIKSSIDFQNKKDVDYLSDYDVVIGNIDPMLINKYQNVKWLHIESAGAEDYSIVRNDCILTNSSGIYGVGISEYIVYYLLHFYKKFNEYQKVFDDHMYKRLGNVDSPMNKRVLIIGMGDIGQETAKRLKCFGSYIVGIKRTIKNKIANVDELYTIDHLYEELIKADVIINALPLTKETNKILGYKELMSCKDDAILINVGRGKTIDTVGLVKALDMGKFSNVALDVVDPEPLPINHKLWRYNRVMITPHITGTYALPYNFDKLIELIIRNIISYENNAELENLIDRKTTYRASR